MHVFIGNQTLTTTRVEELYDHPGPLSYCCSLCLWYSKCYIYKYKVPPLHHRSSNLAQGVNLNIILPNLCEHFRGIIHDLEFDVPNECNIYYIYILNFFIYVHINHNRLRLYKSFL